MSWPAILSYIAAGSRNVPGAAPLPGAQSSGRERKTAAANSDQVGGHSAHDLLVDLDVGLLRETISGATEATPSRVGTGSVELHMKAFYQTIT